MAKFVGTIAMSVLASSSADMLACNACYAATTEIIQRTPILSREAKEEDKSMALYDNFGMYCSSSNFYAYTASPSDFATACSAFLKENNVDDALFTSLVKGGVASTVCAGVCDGIAEEERLTKYTPPPRDKTAKRPAPKAGAPRKGTVDDPAYKEAFKRKAARDARRKANKDDVDEEL